jgi:peptidoglycan hydrolase-like protein with peptidoglycan-binding domain
MISKLDLQRFSTTELAMGGVALATIALVTLIDLRASHPGVPTAAQPQPALQPGVPSAAQLQSAAQPQSPVDQSRLESTGSIDPPPSELSEPRVASREPVEETVDSPSANSNTANSTSSNSAGSNSNTANSAWNVAVLPKLGAEAEASAEPGLNPQNKSDAIWLQARLADLGYFTGSRSGVWGPVSRNALRDFKIMNGLQDDDQWDKETEQRLSSKQVVPAAKTFIGGWAEDIDQCRSGAPLVINSHAAKAAGGECDFRSVRRDTAARWHVEAVCTDGGSSWNANVNLKLNAPKLIWSSERGTATYVRCAKSSGEKGTAIRSFQDWLQGMRKLVFVHAED